MRLIDYIPWQVKFLTTFGRVILSEIPNGYNIYRRLNLFRHGAMDRKEYAFGVFNEHFSRVKKYGNFDTHFTMLELGPGDSLFSALLARSCGVSKSYLVDVGDFAQRKIETYREFISYLQSKGYTLPDLSGITSLSQLLLSVNAEHLTNGITSLEGIPTRSVDFIWSHSVLEHIRRSEFFTEVRELQRILSPRGIMSHTVDLKDHLGGALNQLRIPHSLWESPFYQKYGIYTNRIRCQEMLRYFQKVGLKIVYLRQQKWKRIPTQISKMQCNFQVLGEEDFNTAAFEVVLRPINSDR